MARLVFLNRFYWPDEPATGQLLADLAEALAAAGHEVTVVASRPSPQSTAAETHRGVRIVRVGSMRSGRRGLAAKAADFATFWCGAVWRALRLARPGTTLVALTDPPLLGVGAWFAARLRGARLVHWVQDIYPELAIELAGQRWLRALRPLRDAAWRGAERCVTLGDDMAAVLRRAGVAPARLSVVPNWAPSGLHGEPPRAAADFVVGYSGNLGRVHDLDPVLDLAERLLPDPRIRFLFTGDGARRPALEAAVARRGLRNVAFRPPAPRAGLGAALAEADLHLVTLLPGCERYVFPSKLYGIAAVGRPVLFIGPRDCEIARVVRDGGFGLAATRDELATLAANLTALVADTPARARMAANALRFAAAHSATVAIAHWQRLLTDGLTPVPVSEPALAAPTR